MTTIAYKNGQLVADTAVTAGNTYVAKVKKIIYNKEFNIAFGISGNMFVVGLIQEMINFLNGSSDKPPSFEDADMLIIKNGETYVYQGEHFPVKVENGFAAIGSGSEIAMGAMAAGATAEEAVRIASELDVFTRGPFDILEISVDTQK